MADDEQFSLCWNNFNSNLSAGFHESLCRGDLVDVTLAAEGQFVKAHRLVLSVCSPYFRRMFTQMPANQHAFVFLKDVSHTALKDLIQFMYCGEVNVKQDALPAFISTAEALQIKGLTDSEPAPSQSPAKPSTPAPQPQPQTITTPTMTTATTTTSPRARTSNQRSRYKLESEDSGDENKPTNQLVLQQTQTTQQHQQATLVQQTQKRPAQRSITPHTAPTVKRIKNNDPLEGTDATTTTTQITVQAVTDSKSATGEPEYIDLPIDLPTKSEPDYGEEAADVEAAEQEATYVEDDSYGDMKYDESYFTENEEGGGTTTGATTSTAAVKQSVSFSDSYVSDTGEQQQAATEAQGYMGHHLQNRRRSDKSGQSTPKKVVSLVADTNGQKVVVYDGHHFKQTPDRNGALLFRCVRYETTKCPANILVTKRTKTIGLPHNHEDLATNEMPIASGRKVQVSSEKYVQISSEKKGDIQFENKLQISSENKVHTPIRSNEKALSKGNLQIHSIQKVSKISVNRQKMTGVHLQLKKHKNRKVGNSAQKQSQSGSSNVDRDLPGKNGQYFDQNLSLNDFQSIFKQHFNIKD